MVANNDFDGKATHLNCFYMHLIFEQKYPKPAIVKGPPYKFISIYFIQRDMKNRVFGRFIKTP